MGPCSWRIEDFIGSVEFDPAIMNCHQDVGLASANSKSYKPVLVQRRIGNMQA